MRRPGISRHLALLLNDMRLFREPSLSVQVEGTFFGVGHRGWASGTCANQVATCP